MDIALHPNDDSIVYLTYSKAKEQDGKAGATVALARGRLEGGALPEQLLLRRPLLDWSDAPRLSERKDQEEW